KRFQLVRATAGTGTRAAATMGRREGLMEIQMNYVDAHIAGASNADERIHIGAIHVNQTTGVMNDAANLLNVLLKQSECVWIGQHQSGDVAVGAQLAQMIQIGKTVGS